jgi:hypothetical protein
VLYQHYGIYAGKGRVIHYASKNGDFGSDIQVRETGLKQFANGRKCEAVLFPRRNASTKRFSSQETVTRARSCLGERHYNLLFNNCEHFALWCKYGKNKSVQVEKAFATAVVLGAAAIAVHIANKNEEG